MITGLFNPNALSAIKDFGITYVVGDSSRPELQPDNPYHGLWTTTEKNGYPGIFIVPRYKLRHIFFVRVLTHSCS